MPQPVVGVPRCSRLQRRYYSEHWASPREKLRILEWNRRRYRFGSVLVGLWFCGVYCYSARFPAVGSVLIATVRTLPGRSGWAACEGCFTVLLTWQAKLPLNALILDTDPVVKKWIAKPTVKRVSFERNNQGVLYFV